MQIDNRGDVMNRTQEQIAEELAAAREAEKKLAEEIASVRETLVAAAEGEKETLQEAAISGKALKDSSPFLKAQRRTEELPALLWAEQLRALELQLEYQLRKAEDAKREQYKAGEEAYALKQQEQQLHERWQDANNEFLDAASEWREYNSLKGETRRQLAALQHKGPDFNLLKRSPLRQRP